ncbi:MAG TPA: hypothetical protein VEI83_11875 [Acidimicrobiales bacterium]|nr:hypothetical protein [Acidimicrobiales bacterium]
MSQQDTPKKDHRVKMVLAAVFALAVALFTASAVYAGLTADASGTEQISSGTLSLVLSADAPSLGFSNTFPLMAPGDIDNVAVNVTNNGTLANGGSVSLAVTGDGLNALTNSATEGLTVAVTKCSQAWTFAPGSATCGGSSSLVLATTPVQSLSGGIALASSSLAPGGSVNHLLVSVGLYGTEITHNGVVPPGIQGQTATLTFTFSEAQRAGIVTNQ